MFPASLKNLFKITKRTEIGFQWRDTLYDDGIY